MGLGLEVLSLPKVDSDCAKNIDIVFVHGLNGGSISTWTCDDSSPPCCWPRDILPEHFPAARIMTFGYNANVLVNSIKGRIAEYAENLNGELVAERYSTPNRPIIFICHSMGGIVVKRALIVAQSRKDMKPIYQATHSIIFLATPHLGSDKASLVNIASKLLRMLPSVTSGATQTTSELATFSSVLEDINSDFVNLSEKLKIISFFEKKAVDGIGMIVEPWSAQMHIGAEIHRFAVPRNHMTICRFANECEDEFQTLYKQLRMLVDMAVRQEAEARLERTPEQGSLSSPIPSKKRVLAIEPSENFVDDVQIEREPKARKKRVDDDDDEMSYKMSPWRVPAFISRSYYDRGL